MNVLHALSQLLGVGNAASVTLNAPHPTVKHAPLTQSQTQDYNKQMETDGARMFNQAHPGQTYRVNQNNEFAPGELPSYLNGDQSITNGYLPRPQLPSFRGHLLNNFTPSGRPQVPTFNIQNSGMVPPKIQGNFNPGYVPIQSMGNAPSKINNGTYFGQGG